ncbi:hypothetical protein Tco_0438966 [Tanacetum coccineum]
MARCACGLEAVIRTSWTNRNPGRRFYGFSTLSPTRVNFLWWFDPPMCQRFVQIISGLLRSRNELEEILAMVEEKRRKEVAFFGNLVDYKTREDLKLIQKAVLVKVIELKKELRLQRQFLASVNYRHAIIEELECLPGNLVAYKTREDLKRIQKAILIKVIELKKELHL